MLTEVHAELGPGIEVALGGNSAAAGPLVNTVGDVLGEGGGALDGRLVDLGVLPDVVDGAIAGDLAHLGALGGTSTVVGVLLDVVLNQGAGGPSVDGDEHGAGLGLGGALEVDLAGRALVPALSNDEVAGVGEVDAVAVAGGAELDVARGLVVLVVVLAGGEALALDGAELEVRDIGSGCGKGRASNGGEAEDHRAEGNHFEDWKVGKVGLL